ncbi:hypothetical protein DFP72DRAFT_843034 [Ephemerocybe angulata]|uniref:Uncharacterized protein n=1 Tax=Ephemerocybe angulata TaxID=980116 RepID=A0A8H6MA63_9AGAR|nr:hypothetical protein DFP72DRAFT_843034 [Tulosesus angulatus]
MRYQYGMSPGHSYMHTSDFPPAQVPSIPANFEHSLDQGCQNRGITNAHVPSAPSPSTNVLSTDTRSAGINNLHPISTGISTDASSPGSFDPTTSTSTASQKLGAYSMAEPSTSSAQIQQGQRQYRWWELTGPGICLPLVHPPDRSSINPNERRYGPQGPGPFAEPLDPTPIGPIGLHEIPLESSVLQSSLSNGSDSLRPEVDDGNQEDNEKDESEGEEEDGWGSDDEDDADSDEHILDDLDDDELTFYEEIVFTPCNLKESGQKGAPGTAKYHQAQKPAADSRSSDLAGLTRTLVIMILKAPTREILKLRLKLPRAGYKPDARFLMACHPSPLPNGFTSARFLHELYLQPPRRIQCFSDATNVVGWESSFMAVVVSLRPYVSNNPLECLKASKRRRRRGRPTSSKRYSIPFKLTPSTYLPFEARPYQSQRLDFTRIAWLRPVTWWHGASPSNCHWFRLKSLKAMLLGAIQPNQHTACKLRKDVAIGNAMGSGGQEYHIMK